MDKYEKGEKLGQGQFGVVYKARHKEVSHFCMQNRGELVQVVSPIDLAEQKLTSAFCGFRRVR